VVLLERDKKSGHEGMARLFPPLTNRNRYLFALRKGKTVMLAFFSGLHYKSPSR
jgi:hypothetical protein